MSAEANKSAEATRQALDRVADALYELLNSDELVPALIVERIVCERLAAVAIRALLGNPKL